MGRHTGRFIRYNIVGNNFTNYSSPDNQPMQVLAIGEPEEGDRLFACYQYRSGDFFDKKDRADESAAGTCRKNDLFCLPDE